MSKPRTVTDCITPDEVKKGWTGAVSEDDDCKVTSSSFSGGRTGTMTMVRKWLGAACKP